MRNQNPRTLTVSLADDTLRLTVKREVAIGAGEAIPSEVSETLIEEVATLMEIAAAKFEQQEAAIAAYGR